MLLFQQSEATAAQRRVPIHLVDATDGITPETGEAAGQPQISKNGAGFGNTTATLSAIGNGAYYVELTATELDTLGFIVVRYKSANTAEAQVVGQVVAVDPYASVQAEVNTSLNLAIPGSPTADSINERVKAIDDKLPSGNISGFDSTTATVDVGKIDGSQPAAQNLGRAAQGIVRGAAIAGTLSTTQMTTGLTEDTDDHYNGRLLVFTSGNLAGQETDITDYDGASKLLTFTALTEAPAASDQFAII